MFIRHSLLTRGGSIPPLVSNKVTYKIKKTNNPCVVGSIPTPEGFRIAQVVERRTKRSNFLWNVYNVKILTKPLIMLVRIQPSFLRCGEMVIREKL